MVQATHGMLITAGWPGPARLELPGVARPRDVHKSTASINQLKVWHRVAI